MGIEAFYSAIETTENEKKALVASPGRVKRVKIKRSDASTKIMGGGCEKQVLLTETIGMGEHIFLTVEHHLSKHAGFIAPLVKESKKN